MPAVGEVCPGLRVKLSGEGGTSGSGTCSMPSTGSVLSRWSTEDHLPRRVNGLYSGLKRPKFRQRRMEGHIYRILRGPRSVKVSRAGLLLTGKLWE
jgi:hypothetical protein